MFVGGILRQCKCDVLNPRFRECAWAYIYIRFTENYRMSKIDVTAFMVVNILGASLLTR